MIILGALLRLLHIAFRLWAGIGYVLFILPSMGIDRLYERWGEN